MKKSVTTLLLASAMPVFASSQAYIAAPAANPPHSTEMPVLASVRAVRDVIVAPCDTPTKPVWTLHSSNNGLRPNGDEQQMIWLMNRARQNPTSEGTWLATSDELDIVEGRISYDVDTALLKEEFSAIAAKPPAAPDCRLFEAASSHSDYLIDQNPENPHEGQLNRIGASGFVYTHARGNVFSNAKSALNAHAAFNIDWAKDDSTDPDDGMLDGRGHRKAVMSIDGAYTNVGLALALAPENTDAKEVGPLVVTGNYANANATEDDHFNTFITGTVWEDDTGQERNAIYDPEEGIGGVKVVIGGDDTRTGYSTAYTAAGGGYAIPVKNGDYTVKFSGQGIADYEVAVKVADSKSALLDYKVFICDEVYYEAHPIPEDFLYPPGTVSTICSTVSITVTGATVKAPEGGELGAVLGFNAPKISISSAAKHKFNVENGARFYTTFSSFSSGID